MQKKSAITLDTHFLRHNGDLFVVFHDGAEVRVRLRESRDKNEEMEVEAETNIEDAEARENIQAEVLELLATYKPPIGERPTVFGRNIPEAFWVPAKAVLSRRQRALLDRCVNQLDSIETSYADADGLLLRMSRHPRAPDDMAHMDQSMQALKAALQLNEADTRKRLNSDEKFMQWWGTLRILQAGGWQEKMVMRTLRARVKILTDAQYLAERVSPAASWEEARDALDGCKWYRSILGPWMDEETAEATAALQAVLDQLIDAWPDTASVKRPKKKQTSDGQGQNKGKAGGKSKGKGKAKGQ
jgi:hypothetical protein